MSLSTCGRGHYRNPTGTALFKASFLLPSYHSLISSSLPLSPSKSFLPYILLPLFPSKCRFFYCFHLFSAFCISSFHPSIISHFQSIGSHQLAHSSNQSPPFSILRSHAHLAHFYHEDRDNIGGYPPSYAVSRHRRQHP